MPPTWRATASRRQPSAAPAHASTQKLQRRKQEDEHERHETRRIRWKVKRCLQSQRHADGRADGQTGHDPEVRLACAAAEQQETGGSFEHVAHGNQRDRWDHHRQARHDQCRLREAREPANDAGEKHHRQEEPELSVGEREALGQRSRAEQGSDIGRAGHEVEHRETHSGKMSGWTISA